jgi:glycosyltransferase involved in cell wall biosynthesis
MIYQAVRQADAYIAYTHFEQDYLIERGIPGDKIAVIGVGVDLEPFAAANPRQIRQRFGWGDEPVIAFVGQQVPHKGIDMVIEAMKQIWSERPDACLLIAGATTTYSAFIKRWIEQLTPERRTRVAVIDNFAESEKPSIFAACDIVAFPSGYESFGIVFLEAWAAGKPVIGARVGAVTSVIDEGKDGLLIRHRNIADLVGAIRTLIAQPLLGHQLGTSGRLKVEQRYTWDIVSDKFREIYLQMLSRQQFAK